MIDKTPKIEVDRLRIYIPRKCFGGQHKYLSLGLADTPKNRIEAEKTLRAIQSDYEQESNEAIGR
jgi:hypothetical protein